MRTAMQTSGLLVKAVVAFHPAVETWVRSGCNIRKLLHWSDTQLNHKKLTYSGCVTSSPLSNCGDLHTCRHTWNKHLQLMFSFVICHSQVSRCGKPLGSLPKILAHLWRGEIWSVLPERSCQQSHTCWCWQTCLMSTNCCCSWNLWA